MYNMKDAECERISRSAGGLSSIKSSPDLADDRQMDRVVGLLEEDGMTPLIAHPPPEAGVWSRSVAAHVITVTGDHSLDEVETGTLPEGIDYESIVVPDAAPRGTFADPLEGPEPFGD